MTDRLRSEREADAAAFDSLRTAPTREGVREALHRAGEVELTSSRYPPRVDVTQGRHLYVSAAHLDPAYLFDESEAVTFRVEDMSGHVEDQFQWR